jgi:acid phosphatase class B
VVFDIDHTTLFTAGAFHFAYGYFEERDGGKEREDPDFWTRLFGFDQPPKVMFTAQKPKTEAIRSARPAVSYGDSDGDIADTRKADSTIRVIRILRSPYSYNLQTPSPGKYGEEILAGSAD